MATKICIFFLSFIVIFSVWVNFADVIDPNTHYVNRCAKLQNVEIDDYRIIVENDTATTWDVYEPNVDECLMEHYKFWESRQYLLDKSIDINDITQENIQDLAIQIWNLNVNWHYVDDSNPLPNENFIYKIVKNWDDYKLEELEGDITETIVDESGYSLEIVKSEQGVDVTSSNRLVNFWIARILTILIETIVLFVIAKLFRKKDQISNWRILLIWILASTITLPLLRFVIPLFITDGLEYTVIWELFVTFLEIFIIKYWLKVSRWKAIISSIICNLCSYLFGVLFL